MRPQLTSRLFLVLLLAAAVFLFMRHASRAATPLCQKEPPAVRPASTQLLWESLSRQFVSIQPY